jgi:hypothetical protein
MRRCLFFLTALLAMAARGDACAGDPRAAGEPLSIPASVVEVRVLDVVDEPFEDSPGRFKDGQRARFEITASLLGPMRVGTLIEKLYATSGCFGHRLMNDSRALLADFDSGGELSFYEVVGAGESFLSVHGRFVDGERAWRASPRSKLAGARLSGDLNDAVADELLNRSGLGGIAACDIVLSGEFVQIACGDPTVGAGMRARVIYENVDGKWEEVFRWKPASSPDVASADSTS